MPADLAVLQEDQWYTISLRSESGRVISEPCRLQARLIGDCITLRVRPCDGSEADLYITPIDAPEQP